MSPPTMRQVYPPFEFIRVAGSGIYGRIYAPQHRQSCEVWAGVPQGMTVEAAAEAARQGRAWFDQASWRLVVR